ncbi:MAG: NAD(P)-dependent oxidoreductase, partial [Cellvibrionales bacterium]|nr:NAD(P)-dependent oxidoreductase [Cellvibrionales bacterium]
MDFLPLFHNLKCRRVIVIGGGEIALRKVRLVAEADAYITIVAQEICNDLIEMRDMNAKKGIYNLELITASYQQQHIENIPDAVLVIAATNDPELNREVSKHAQQAHMLSNVVDDPGYSTVIFP